MESKKYSYKGTQIFPVHVALQEAKMGDMRTKAQVAEVLSAYHPFWLRLGLEVVVGKAVPKGATSRAELEAFAHDHFLGDADLALQRAGNRAIVGLHSADYWVITSATQQ